VIDVVPAPAVIDHPVGTAQLYVVALVTAAMLYVCAVKAGHCVAVPEMAAGVAGAGGLTVTVPDALFAAAQTLFVTIALYEVVAVKFVAVNVVVVLAIAVPAVAKLFKEDSQPLIVPVYPLNVNVVEFVPEHTVVPPEIVPPTDTGEIVTEAVEVYAEHNPVELLL